MSRRYQKDYSAEDNIDENEDTDTQNNDSNSQEGGGPVSSPEEDTWRKRHGDLRRHTNQQIEELKNQIRELSEKSETKEVKLPKSEQELEAWMKKFPDVGAVIETIATKKAMEMSGSSKIKELEDRLKAKDIDRAKEKAYAELLEAHPDFNTLRLDSKFQEWIDDAPTWVVNALRHNDTDSASAIDAVSKYKSSSKSANKSRETAAASAVRPGAAARPSNGSDAVYSESMLNSMSDAEYEKHSDKIDKARREGKFVYDLSGSA